MSDDERILTHGGGAEIRRLTEQVATLRHERNAAYLSDEANAAKVEELTEQLAERDATILRIQRDAEVLQRNLLERIGELNRDIDMCPNPEHRRRGLRDETRTEEPAPVIGRATIAGLAYNIHADGTARARTEGGLRDEGAR